MTEYNLEYEKNLLDNKNLLSCMNNLLSKNQFTEDFLIKTRIYYDSWKCLRKQKNLSPYFCFYWLYDRQDYDSADDWTDYNQVYDYLKDKYDHQFIVDQFKKATQDREQEKNKEN
jgi:hypothetical protein